ncbi:MAG: hypothetical protein LBK13_00260, partial [Spirochaetales bacterium]|nr:hypothetical protein [Spirochaetales bacterium]
SEEDEPVLTELRHRGYRELPDPATEDLTYPVFGAGAWYGVGTLDEEGSLSNVYAFTGEVRFSEYFGLVMEAGTLRFGYDQQNMYGWDDYVYENFGIFSLLGELILQPVEGFELDFLAGLYYGGHNSKGRFISKGIGLESGVNAGVRLDRNYIYYMFRAATYVDYGNGHNASEYSLMQGIGYRYLFSDEAEKPETLADSRRKRERLIEDAQSQAPYPFISTGVWGGINLETDFIENEELGEEKYPIAGLAFLDLHLTENFGFALETGRMAFEWEKVTMYPTGYFGGYYYQNEDVTTTEFIVSVLEEFTLPLGQDFQLDLLAGLYYGGHNTGGGFEGGANLRLKWGNHNFAAMFRVGQSFYEYSRGPYNDSDTEDFTVIGGGYIYNFQTETADTRKIPPQYIGAADDDPADSAHPFLRTGGWGGLAVMPSDGHSNMGAFVASADIVFARYFALGMEAGSMPFRRTERNPWSGASESMTDANGTGALFAEFTVQASDVIETSLILGSYYGGEKGGLGLLYCGADVGFVFGRHHILGIFRYARDSFSASEKMAVAGGGYKYDLY